MVEMSSKNNNLAVPDIQAWFYLDYIRLLGAFLVIGIHTSFLTQIGEKWDYIYKSDIAEFAVPFFYACTGFFLIFSRPDIDFNTKLKGNIFKIFRLYILWSLLYLPLTVIGCLFSEDSIMTYAFKCLRNYLFVGENFYSWQLWYLHGLLVALLGFYLLKRILSDKGILVVASALYIVGILINSANAQIINVPDIFSGAVTLYFKIFVTTRNGIFQSLAFVMVGYWVAFHVKTEKFKLNYPVTIMFGFVLYLTKVICDVKMIWGGYCGQCLTLPVFCILFMLIISHGISMYDIGKSKSTGRMGKSIYCRNLSANIYYIHMYFVAICSLLFGKDYKNIWSFFIVASVSIVIGTCLVYCKKRYKMKS